MVLLSRKSLLAVAAVIDVAVHAQDRPVSAKTLAARHSLPARHLEPVLQALVRMGILKGIRGPRGGYELARERRRITADEILRAAGTIEDDIDPTTASSALLNDVVVPAVSQAEKAFSLALSRINLDDLVRQAEPLRDVTMTLYCRTARVWHQALPQMDWSEEVQLVTDEIREILRALRMGDVQGVGFVRRNFISMAFKRLSQRLTVKSS